MCVCLNTQLLNLLYQLLNSPQFNLNNNKNFPIRIRIRFRTRVHIRIQHRSDVELRHQRNLKDLKAAYDAEKQALDKRDISNANEIEQLHRKCRCLTNL